MERLKLLYEVTMLQHGSAAERIAAALETVTTSLGLEIGILSHIRHERYIVEQIYAPAGTVQAGAEFELGQTYCSLTLAANGVKSINRMATSPHIAHPCYAAFGLESYIGAAVQVKGRLYGTVNFSATTPRATPFTRADEELIATLARWLGVALELEATEARRQESEERFRLLTEASFEAIAVSEEGVIHDANENFCTLFGYSHAEVVGLSASELTVAQDGQRVREKIRTRDEAAYEVTCLRKDGSTFTAEVRGKNLPLPERVLRVTAIHDITERKRAEAKLQHDAQHDALTGLKNRSAFSEGLRHAGERAKRYPDYRFAVLFLDFDRFKAINDTLGHLVGDELLVAIGKRLQASVRAVDTVARLGGDEFIVLLDAIDEMAEAHAIAEKVLKALSEPFTLADQRIYMTASIGVAMNTSSPERPEYLIRNADAAMYRAKATGKARVVVFDEAMQSESRALVHIERKLHDAVAEERFELHYLPVIALASKRTVAFEALLRWPQPDGGSLVPEQFLPVAEESGLIVPLGYWTLRRACRQGRLWQQRFGDGELRVQVNLSGRQFLQPDLDTQLGVILDDSGLPPASLILEVPENAVMHDPQKATRIMERLKALGVRLQLDNFGTGLSSLSYLHRFPIDALKIDRSFVGKMTTHAESARIVETIVTLAHQLALNVVAEGIEKQIHVDRLLELGCAYGQGYFFTLPRPAAEAGAFVLAPVDSR